MQIRSSNDWLNLNVQASNRITLRTGDHVSCRHTDVLRDRKQPFPRWWQVYIDDGTNVIVRCFDFIYVAKLALGEAYIAQLFTRDESLKTLQPLFEFLTQVFVSWVLWTAYSPALWLPPIAPKAILL